MRRRRHVPPDLTSLFDVLFIVIFAALIRAAAAEHAAAEAAKPPPLPEPKPLDPASLQARAAAALATRPPVIVRVSAAGTITALEVDGKTTPLDVPLLEHSPDPDVAIAYLGERSAELRVCRVVALHVAAADLARYLVIVAPERALADLPHALYEGLRRDVDRCMAEQRGLAVIVEPDLEQEHP
jgi:hypothetical protein